jgi:hypothetical protein
MLSSRAVLYVPTFFVRRLGDSNRRRLCPRRRYHLTYDQEVAYGTAIASGGIMRRLLLAILVMAFGCSGEVADTGKTLERLSTDPWEGIYAVQQIDSNHFYVNPVVATEIQCPDGYWLDRCLVAKVNLGYTGLSLTLQNNVRARLPGEPPYESSVSVLMKGSFVNVRDHSTEPPTYYPEFRATAVYMAPRPSDHGIDFRYVEAGPDNDYYYTRAVNLDMIYSRNFNPATRSRLLWIGPGSAPTYPQDSIIADRALRQLDPGMLGGRIELDVDQLFTRVQ